MKKNEIKNILDSSVFAVTQSCHKQSKILKFSKNRNAFTVRLNELNINKKVDIINWLVLPKEFIVLTKAQNSEMLAKIMHRLKTVTSGDYTRRTKEEAPFWNGKYIGTLVQQGCHVMRYSISMDKKVIAKTKCLHAVEWQHSGVRELCGIKKRYRLNKPSIAFKYMNSQENEFEIRNEYIQKLESNYQLTDQYLAIGSQKYVKNIFDNIRPKPKNISITKLWDEDNLGVASYSLKTSAKLQYELIRSLKIN